MDDKHRLPIIAAIAMAWLTATFFLARFAIPALINTQNDGAIIFCIVIAIGWLYSSYLIYRFVKDFSK